MKQTIKLTASEWVWAGELLSLGFRIARAEAESFLALKMPGCEPSYTLALNRTPVPFSLMKREDYIYQIKPSPFL
jgi:hypothetical protein